MARLANWQANLTALIEIKRNEPFAFGTFDCSLWAGLAIEAVNGINIYSKYTGTYTTAFGAAKRLRQVDKVKTPIEVFDKALGERQPIAFAKKGDIVFTSDSELVPGHFDAFGPVLGVCYGHNSVFVGELGLILIETFKLDGCLWVS